MDRHQRDDRTWSMTAFGVVPRLGELVTGSLPTPPWTTHLLRNCKHPECELRLKTYDSGVVQARRQCLSCGQAVGTAYKKTLGLGEWDAHLESLVRDDYTRLEAEYQAALSNERERQLHIRQSENSEFWRFYNEYLRSPQWHRKRQLVMRRCGGVCESCGQAAAEQVHHVKYPATFGLEPLWDLRAVCYQCHKIIHPHMD